MFIYPRNNHLFKHFCCFFLHRGHANSNAFRTVSPSPRLTACVELRPSDVQACSHGGMEGHRPPPLEINLPPQDFTADKDTLTSHSLLDAQSIYEMPSVSRCRFCHAQHSSPIGIDRPQRRSMPTARQANLVHLTFEKRRSAALDLTEFLRCFAKKHTRLQLF